jgi:hypothetical protein
MRADDGIQGRAQRLALAGQAGDTGVQRAGRTTARYQPGGPRRCAMKYAFDGLPAGSYRDGNRVLPLRMRAAELERGRVEEIRDVQIWSAVLGRTVPASAVISGYRTDWENALLRSRNRIQTIIASCNPRGELATPLFERLRPQIEAIDLPPGYELAWGGEYEDNRNAQQGLARSLPRGHSRHDPDQHRSVRKAAPAPDHLAHRAPGDRWHHGGPAEHRRRLRLHVHARRPVPDRPADQERHRPDRGDRPADRGGQGALRRRAGLLREPARP